MSRKYSIVSSWATLASVATLALAGCGQSPTPEATANTAEPPVAAEPILTEAEREAELAARESELAAREAELAMKQKADELAAREAAVAAKERAAAQAKTAKVAETRKRDGAPKPAAVLATTNPLKATTQSPASVKVKPITVPAGTQFSVGLSSDVSTKTAKVGDPVDARLASDLVVNGRTALAAGAPVRGTVTEVVSGSQKIGGIPTLAMTFDRLELENGRTVAINGRVVQQGKSDTAKDTAKIVGGTAAGAVIGHQIGNDDKGTVIGGLLGGAAGAVAAKKTGGEVNVPAGTVVVFTTDAPFKVGS